jgi:hypothetical protein
MVPFLTDFGTRSFVNPLVSGLCLTPMSFEAAFAKAVGHEDECKRHISGRKSEFAIY